MNKTLKSILPYLITALATFVAVAYYKDQESSTITMAETLKVGDSIPEGVKFSYIPYTPEKAELTACGIPTNYDATKGESPEFVLFYVL